MIQSFLEGQGDFYFALRDSLDGAGIAMRAAGLLCGVALYAASVRLVRRNAGAATTRTMRIAWIAATASAVLAASAYSPSRLAAMGEAFLEIGLAGVALLFAFQPQRAPAPVQRSALWTCAAALVFALFTATMGVGLTTP